MKDTKTERAAVIQTHTVRVPERPRAAKRPSAALITTREVRPKQRRK
jgi:hypothetical protein